ncbi:hypothetical protein [Rhizorhapis sp. SPR117]|uniref:hypothetical protein n=1 Tax=Rhizorhapis sp. SPR117 TaxID=2912611 RepID=UPI001F46649D|nr:hypothetical protein [Rhizorhapis sp. SPR117]
MPLQEFAREFWLRHVRRKHGLEPAKLVDALGHNNIIRHEIVRPNAPFRWICEHFFYLAEGGFDFWFSPIEYGPIYLNVVDQFFAGISSRHVERFRTFCQG